MRRRNKHRSIPISRLSQRSRAARDRGFHVLAAMRNDPSLSLTRAARLEGVKPDTVKRYFPKALERSHGKFSTTKSDRYRGTLYVPDFQGNSVAVNTRSSKDREALGQYLRDLGRYLRGDRDALARWRGQKSQASSSLPTNARSSLWSPLCLISPCIAHSAAERNERSPANPRSTAQGPTVFSAGNADSVLPILWRNSPRVPGTAPCSGAKA